MDAIIDALQQPMLCAFMIIQRAVHNYLIGILCTFVRAREQ